ncbi:MAG: hypothetical protein J7545_22270 [Roseofilum sp. SBFL]|uniref:hypothetical protein n=1 Tax=unclassified Roseofilum TaxID=2620099 RepID=UPI001B27663D|nr:MULTISPECIES: hypothetical protein [unclassified Roseofilum]MBP0013567.1 hypothetical protein [Roseofilum sp. SID3]MBP0022916.1 hypothetical protein [Roseofilum sp. SID2]MBP0036216.1 hypothetical protein [Roseofilum sp. SID1]MBP0044665.1 hypothetical protein [Roseofilum sp. SBFL]
MVDPSQLDNILQQYYQSFTDKVYADENNDIDLLMDIPLFCHFPKKGPQTLILSLAIAGCNDGNSLEFPRVTEEGYSSFLCYEVH